MTPEVRLDAQQFRELTDRLGRIEALLKELVGEEPAQPCPRCGGAELAQGRDALVCAGCGANVRDGEVVAG